MADKNRNERISQGIAHLLNESYEYVYDKVSKLTKDRGKLAHTTLEQPTIIEHIHFIEKILHSYLKLPIT